jgi:hypothetical protein
LVDDENDLKEMGVRAGGGGTARDRDDLKLIN